MGIIDRLRGKTNAANEENKKVEMTNEDKEVEFKKRDGRRGWLHDIQIRKAMHIGQIPTKIILGQLSVYQSGEAINFHEGSPICIEIPDNVPITAELLTMLEQSGWFDQLSNDQYNVLGRLMVQDGQWTSEAMSEILIKQVVEPMNEKLQEERRLQQQKKEESINLLYQHQEEKRQYTVTQKAPQYKEPIHPIFQKSQGSLPNSLSKENYMTVDQITGESVLLEHVQKLGKDRKGEGATYLYSAEITKSSGEAQRLDLLGCPIFFTTVKKLDEIAQEQDPRMIASISQLFSGVELTKEEKLYIGGLDQFGQVNRDDDQISEVLGNHIKRLQQQYREQRKEELQRKPHNLER